MLNLSQYFLPQENKAPVVEIREVLSNETPSIKEFVKNYESDEEIVRSYDNEFEFQVLQGPQYGPGSSSNKERGYKKRKAGNGSHGPHLINFLNNTDACRHQTKEREIGFDETIQSDIN